MASCPSCKADIEDDIGVVVCAACGAQVLLELSGEASIANYAEVKNVETHNADAHIVAANNAEPPATPAVDIASMQDVVDYANSTESQGREGLLRFNLNIIGIDSAEVRKQIINTLTDSRFLWDVTEIMTTIKDGQLNLRDLTAVKAALLVHRLRSIPVEISWEQYAIHQN